MRLSLIHKEDEAEIISLQEVLHFFEFQIYITDIQCYKKGSFNNKTPSDII